MRRQPERGDGEGDAVGEPAGTSGLADAPRRTTGDVVSPDLSPDAELAMRRRLCGKAAPRARASCPLPRSHG